MVQFFSTPHSNLATAVEAREILKNENSILESVNGSRFYVINGSDKSKSEISKADFNVLTLDKEVITRAVHINVFAIALSTAFGIGIITLTILLTLSSKN